MCLHRRRWTLNPLHSQVNLHCVFSLEALKNVSRYSTLYLVTPSLPVIGIDQYSLDLQPYFSRSVITYHRLLFFFRSSARHAAQVIITIEEPSLIGFLNFFLHERQVTFRGIIGSNRSLVAIGFGNWGQL
jgi:hypothetical protein